MSDDYSIEKNKKYTLKLRKLLEELPVSCSEYFRGIESSSSVMTRYLLASQASGIIAAREVTLRSSPPRSTGAVANRSNTRSKSAGVENS